MSKPTKSERHNLYQEALNEYILSAVDSGRPEGLCPVLAELYSGDSRKWNHVESWFPELSKQRPPTAEEYYYYWGLEDIDSRISALEKCIELTK